MAGKSGELENESGNISETRKDRGKLNIGTHQRSFERCHPRALTASPSPRLGVRNHHSKSNLKSRENECTEINSLHGWHRIFLGGIESVGIARDRTNFLASAYTPLSPSLLTQKQVKLVSYGLQIW